MKYKTKYTCWGVVRGGILERVFITEKQASDYEYDNQGVRIIYFEQARLTA